MMKGKVKTHLQVLFLYLTLMCEKGVRRKEKADQIRHLKMA
jgi:hypothetical protein